MLDGSVDVISSLYVEIEVPCNSYNRGGVAANLNSASPHATGHLSRDSHVG